MPALVIMAAASITVLDGFDAFSLSVMAPRISADLHIPTAALGRIFASAMGGMILGAIGGGTLADKVGRLGTLLAALMLFASASLIMPWAVNPSQISIDRLVAGVGLGAAAPIAIALLNRSAVTPPSELVVAIVWAGLPLGGCLAGLFNYVFSNPGNWKAIFIVGGILPLPLAVLAWVVFRRNGGAPPLERTVARSRFSDLFHHGLATRTVALAGTFFFGYVTTSIIAFWLPTILSHRAASALMISVSFAAFNIGGVVAIGLLGVMTKRIEAKHLLPIVWIAAGVCGLAATSAALGTVPLALLAVSAYTIGGGANTLSVAAANSIYRKHGIETTAVGLMTGIGRLGQASALAASGAVVSVFGKETALFGMAGVCACVAGLCGLLVILVAHASLSALPARVSPSPNSRSGAV